MQLTYSLYSYYFIDHSSLNYLVLSVNYDLVSLENPPRKSLALGIVYFYRNLPSLLEFDAMVLECSKVVVEVWC